HPAKHDLRSALQRILQAFGPERILFGSDSGLFPRRYQYDILDNQLKLLQEMRIPAPDIKKIFYDNLAGLIDG
ncbi:MAG: amidohydrolase family protein, partial [Bacteroidota bacterium]